MNIGTKIKKLREGQGITQRQLAKKAGLSREGISYIETSAKTPTLESRKKIAKALGVEIVTLLD